MTPAELETTVRAVAATLNEQRLAAQQAEMQCDTSGKVLATSSTTLRDIATALLKSVGKRARDVPKELVEVVNNVAAVLTGESQKLGLQAVNLDTMDRVLEAQVSTLNRIAPQIGALVVPPPVVIPPPIVEPPPVIEPPPVVTSSALFDDVFADGKRAAPKNGVSYGEAVAGGPTDAIAVIPDPTNVSGYALGFTYGGNPDITDDVRLEQFVKFPPLTDIYIGMEIGVPANYVHRDAAPDNNKLLRLWDATYQGSTVHVGMSTIYKPGTTPGRSQMIVEYSTPSGTGNQGTGPWNLVFAPGAVERVVFRHKVASGVGVADGTIQVWWNGKLVYDRHDLPTTKTSPSVGAVNAILNGYLFGWSNSGFTETTTMRLRRFVVDTKPIVW